MKRLILFIVFFAIADFSFAEKRQQVFKDFGKVDETDFAPTDYDDLGYDAIILFDEKKVYFDTYGVDLRLFNVVHKRIKVMNDCFSDSTIFSVDYSGRNEFEKIIYWKFSVFSHNGTKIVQSKLKNKYGHRINSDSIESQLVISIPPVKKGDIIDFEYCLTTFDFMLPPAFDFKYKYPCLNSELVTNFPEHMQYKFDIQDDTNPIDHTDTESFQTLSYLFSPQDNPNSIAYMQGRSRKFPLNFKFHSLIDTFKTSYILPFQVPENQSEDDLGYSRVIMKAYKFTQNIGYTHPIYTYAWRQMTHLLYTYADPENRYISQSEAWFKMYNAGYVIVNSDSWTLLHKRLKKSTTFWRPLMKSYDLDEEIGKIIEDAEFADTLVTAQKIFNYVNSNIKWDSTFSNHLDKNIEKILKLKTGSSADVNMTLVSLLRRAGLDAFPALAATHDFGRVDTSYANKIQFNNVLAILKLSDDYCLIMDCTVKNQPYNKLPIRDLNNFCWAVAPEEGFFIKLFENCFR